MCVIQVSVVHRDGQYEEIGDSILRQPPAADTVKNQVPKISGQVRGRPVDAPARRAQGLTAILPLEPPHSYNQCQAALQPDIQGFSTTWQPSRRLTASSQPR
jgi:hypothetical protein